MGLGMSGQSLRKQFMVQFTGLKRYSRAGAWLVVSFFILQIAAAIWFGAYLLSVPVAWYTVVLMIMTAFFIGTRLRGLNNIVHECCHSSFSEHRPTNVHIGRFNSVLLTGCFKTYKDDHLSHHAHLGDYENDRELAVIEKFGLHEPLTRKTALRHFVTPLLGRHLPAYSGINLSNADGTFFFALKVIYLIALVAAAMLAPWTVLFFVLIPLFYIFPTLNFWTDCLDHAGIVGEEDELSASRNVLAPEPIRSLLFPRHDCYHLVHHLFPQVPAQHLAQAHEELCADPEYRAQPQATRPTHQDIWPSQVSFDKTMPPAE